MPTGDALNVAEVGADLRATADDDRRKSETIEHQQHPHHGDLDLVPKPPPGMDPEDFPSEEDLHTLRRVSDSIPWKLFTIAFVEACERFSYYGSTIVFTNYIQQPLPPGSVTGAGGGCDDCQSGAMGFNQRTSTGITTFNQFWQYFMPLFGAYVADQYWGRYKTINIALGVDIIGHIILILSAIPPVITKPNSSMGALVVALLVIGFGTGGFKPNISPLIAEQLPTDHLRVKTLRSGERVIIDPAITINRVYNWFYLFINTGALIGQIVMVYAEKYVGFWLSFTLPTLMLCVAPLIMIWGKKHYGNRPPAGSVLGKAFATWTLAQKGRWSINPVKTWKNLHQDNFWENVKPSKFAPGTKPKWMTFDDAWVDELRRGFAACAVFTYYPIYWLTYNQITNNLISQAAVMKLNGLPNDVVGNLDPLALIILIPVVDYGLYPLLRHLKINFTPVKRITFGFFLGTAAMIWATVIQQYIYWQSECGYYAADPDCKPTDINVWAQTGSYVLIGVGEIFTSITSLEYAFSKAPKNMRSMVQAVALFTSALSAALGEAFVSVSQDPLLVWNYGIMGVLSFIAGVLFWIQFRDLDKEEDALNELPEGKMFVDDEESAHDAASGSPAANGEKQAVPAAGAGTGSGSEKGDAPVAHREDTHATT